MSSIYIPRIGMSVTTQMVLDVFNSTGVVTHVEFIQINVIPGLIQNVYKSAFIYFESVIQEDIMWKTISLEGTFIIEMTQSEYWVCLQNFNQVQIINNKYTHELEQILELQSVTISKQSEVVQKQQQFITELTTPKKNVVETDPEFSDMDEFVICSLNTDLFDFYLD